MHRPTQHAKRALDKETLFADLGYEPHEGQQAVHDSTASRRVVACGVRWGKTRCAAMEAVAAALQPAERSMGWIVAPTYSLSEKVFREIELIVAKHLRHRIVSLKENEQCLILRNLGAGLSEIRGKSADNSVSLLGEGLDFLIVDEAARLKPSIWESHLSQRLIDRQGWALLISTPRGRGWFHDLFLRGQRGMADHASWNAPSWHNTHLNRDLIEAERDRLPERVFRQEFGGEFIEGAGSVFRKVREVATAEWAAPRPDEVYCAGLDLAKVTDYTVVVVMDSDAHVVAVDRFHRIDWSLQVGRIRALCERYNDAHILVDSTGSGEPVFEALRHAGCSVEGYAFTQKSKAALIDNLSMMIEQQQLRLPRYELWPEGIDELEAYEYSITDSGNVRMSSPSGSHDDCVIGTALAAWQKRPGGRWETTMWEIGGERVY